MKPWTDLYGHEHPHKTCVKRPRKRNRRQCAKGMRTSTGQTPLVSLINANELTN